MVVEETGEPFFRLPAEGGLALEFAASFPYGPDDPDIIGLLIRVSGAFVQVEHPVVLSRHGGPSGFLHLLYEDFRGWTGARTWRSLEGELQLSAVHEGHVVRMQWLMTNLSYTRPAWSFWLNTEHAPGEDMRRLSAEFHDLLAG